jgi:alkyl sulfatase BDS1-like metallo-beta-lactamase superfamily hydrolase
MKAIVTFQFRHLDLKVIGRIATLLTGLVLVIPGCTPEMAEDADANGFSAPSEITRRINAKAGRALPLDDQEDYEDARRGLVAAAPHLLVTDDEGAVLWNMAAFDFIQGQTPASVNPILWRQARLNRIHGLFEVTSGIYQLRGFDLANMTLIAGATGWIVIDPLTTRETAAAALAFARQHLPDRPVSAIIYTHSHIDHFGGVLGVITPEEARDRKIPVIAPAGFMAEATSENIIAGIAMGRRAAYQFGRHLPPAERAYVDLGLGKQVAFGSYGILAPTASIDHTPQEMIVDGIPFIFQYTPESEAPAELAFFLPEHRAYCGAEIVSHTMHNLYTLRGAKVRDALKWSRYIDEAITRFGGVEILFASHHWPIWGNARILDFLEKQRDLYRYIHDQTMRLANAGFTPREIAEQLELPESLDSFFPNRGYYGSLRQNAKAVYQAYLGWYDGNPANLDPLPPEVAAVRYVDFMGGADALLAKARRSFAEGDYRWVAEVLNHLVFAQPDHREAKALLARTYDQLGYQAESGVWRNAYLTAAQELRQGTPDRGLDLAKAAELLKRTPPAMFFDSMAVRLDGPAAAGKTMVLNVVFTDIKESYVLTLKNAVLHHRAARPDPAADVTLEITHDLFVRMLTGQAGLKATLFSDQLAVSGSRLDLLSFLMLLDRPEGNFKIVVP